MKNFTTQEKQDIIKAYLTGTSRNQLVKQYQVSDNVILRILKENDIEIRNVTQANSNRKYQINDFYFDTQSSNMAYILGFWAADGTVHSKENRMDLELAEKDYEILEKIRLELQSERPIKVYECANGYKKNKLVFWSSRIKKRMAEYGIVPNKTYSQQFHAPYLLQKKYWIDYIRGFFDGDGCVKQTGGSSNYHYPAFELNSLNKDFLIDIQKYFLEEHSLQLNISTAGIRAEKEKLYRLYCSGTTAREIFKLLYTPNSLYLERKYKRWLEIL